MCDTSYTPTMAGVPRQARERERVGVLGGTFDPIHIAHLVAALGARHALGLDRVLLVVAGDPWQKHASVVASATDRLAMAAWDDRSEADLARLIAALTPAAAAVSRSGVIRYPNPIGLPPLT